MAGVCSKDISIEVVTNITPCDLSEADSTVLGTFSPNPNDPAVTVDDIIAASVGQYQWEYIGGAFFSDSNPFPGQWKIPSTGYHVYRNSADSATDLLFNSYSGPTQLAVEAGAFTDLLVTQQFLHQTGSLGVRLLKAAGLQLNFVAGSPNPTWRITRIRKPITAPSNRLRVVPAQFAGLAATLVPLPGAGPGVSPAYDGTMPTRNIPLIASDWSWQTTGGQLFTRELSDAEVYHTTWEPLSPSTCAWICGFAYSSGGSWAGIGGGGFTGGGGLLPYGRFYFTPDLFSFSLGGQYADVRLATITALPANTRVGNVLTANAFGFLPAIDGVAPALGNRILVKNEVLGANLGVYTVTNAGSPVDRWVLTRATDMDTSPEVTQGIFVEITEGATLGNTYWRLVTLDPITLNTTPLSWLQIPPFIDIEEY